MVSTSDLLAPKGPVEVTLFPGESDPTTSPTALEARLQEYIDQAEVKAGEVAFPQPDDAVKAWALHLTFEAAYVLAISRAATDASLVPIIGNQGFQKDQRDGLKALADFYKAQFLNLVPIVITDPQVGYQTRQIINVYEW